MDQAQRASMQHRLKRRKVWVSLWLTRLLGLLQLFGGEPREGALHKWFERRIDGLAQWVVTIIFFRAAMRMQAPLCGNQGVGEPPSLTLRAVMGSDLRRAFKAKTLSGRLAKIRRALEREDVLVARLARRLRLGLTRLCSAHSRARLVRAIGACAMSGAGVLMLASMLVLGAAAMDAADTS